MSGCRPQIAASGESSSEIAEGCAAGVEAPRADDAPARRRPRCAVRPASARASRSSSLTRRIVVLNLAGLVALLVGFSTSTSSAQGLIDARVQSLLTQGEIIAGAVAASATVETDAITIDPDQLLQMQAGETYGPATTSTPALEFSINPERVAPLLRRLVTPTRTRARIYDRDGSLLLDSPLALSRGDILRFDLPPVDERGARPSSSASGTDLRSAVPTAATCRSTRRSARRTARPCRRCSRRFAGARASDRARQCAGRDHRLGRGADPALPRRCAASCCCRRRAATSTTIIASERFAILRVFLRRGAA